MVLLSRPQAVSRGALFALCVLLSPRALTAEETARIDFGKQIRPILAERCYECHGPENQEGSLRLDRRADAQRGGDSGTVIEPRAAAASRLVQVLESDNEDERMPLGKKPLKPAEIDLIKRWIAAGAEWPDAWSGDAAAAQKAHWSFQSPHSPPLPSLRSDHGVQNPIDWWVAARLEQAGLSFSPEADRHTLIRRLYLDLLGLLPTPEQADQFAADTRPDAYERLVDELLGSPQYGVRWARRWLDLARYADTNGYEKDRPRSIWPYRDWVVRALNEDIPFDRFSIQQLAGDLLPSPSLDDRLATGFHRNTMVNEEGGIDPLEFRYHAIVDRVNTTGTVWLGLTVGCAQCHSHKYDPLQQTEYYQLLAFLNQCDELDMPVPDERVDAQRREREQQIAKLEAELPQHFPLPEASGESAAVTREDWVEKRFQQWLAEESAAAVRWQVLRPAEATSNLPLLSVLADDSVLASGDQTKSDIYQLRYPTKLKHVTAIRLEALPHETLPLHGPGRAYYEGPKGDFFLSEFRVSSGGEKLPIASASHSYSKLSIGSGEHGAALTFDGNTTTGWSTSGREGEPHAAVFTFEKPVDLTGDLSIEMVFERHFSCGLGRFRISVATETSSASARGHTADIEALLAKPANERTEEDRKQLFKRFLEMAPELEKARGEIQKLRAGLPKPTTSLVLRERPDEHQRKTHRHHRGEYLQPKDLVEANVPAFLPPFPADLPRDRLGFARWLLSPHNPLTARVTVNRHWQAFFGRGLVRTLEDFGIQGEPPTHPGLLDWLAVDFATGGTGDPAKVHEETAWSVKRLHRLIVTSRVYRQSSQLSRELADRDPENRLLARGPRGRLDAEVIRDAALDAAGLLSFKFGGPGVYPPQPASVTTEGTYGALKWTPSPGEDRYRRSLFTYIKRTAPFAMYATFDAPSGEACVPRREPSNSPLQALTLLNDVIFQEAAKAIGQHAARQPGGESDRAAWIFRCCLTRPPADEELQAIVQFAQQQRARFADGRLNARAFSWDGEGELVEQATWTAVARAILNLDESFTKS